MQVESRPIESIKPYPKNAKKHPEKQVSQIAKSIEEFGFNQPIVVDKKGYIIVGHGRLEGAKALGLKEVPVLELDLTENQAKAYRLADNKLNESEWDMDLVIDELKQLELEDLELVEITGFDLELLEDEPTAEEDDFEIPDEVKTDIVLGDLFEIGEHRLLCGDSTDSDQVEKLMNGERADMVFTDPPYGNGSSGEYGRGLLGVRTILSDENFDVVNDFFNLRVCNVYVFFLQWRTFKEAIQTLENNNLQLKTIAVWDKKNAGLNGAGGMSEQWEAIIVAGNVKYSRFGGNVFSISREQKKRIDSPHPHQKPIELLNNILEYFQDYNLLLDPFLGSGSTMVASHQLKRKCYGMELDPKYCQVIIDRMLKLDPTLEIKKNGLPYNPQDNG